jgi:predicted DNA-binding transcriptional regulator YafY
MKEGKPSGISEKVIRLLEIYTMIAQKNFPSVAVLKEHFGISERSVYRYLEIINMIDGIEYDQERKGYKFTNGDRIKKLTLSDNELLVLLAASEAVSHLGESLGESFQELVNKVAVPAKRPGAKHKIPIVVKIPEAIGNEKLSDYFASVSRCLNERRAIELVYRAQRTKEVTERIVDPYGLVFYDGIWMLIGYCHLRKDIRSFTFDRILNLKERNLYFKPRDDFNLEEYLSHSWGVVEDEEVKVKVRFSAGVADYVLRKKWHPSEERKVLPNGDVEMTYKVAGVDEIKHWIYSWLPNVEILEPSSLREQAAAELTESTKKHLQEH